MISCSCCSKLNRENYDQLKMRISYAEASTILGKTERCDDALGTTSRLWGGEGKNIKIRFIADKATFLLLAIHTASPEAGVLSRLRTGS